MISSIFKQCLSKHTPSLNMATLFLNQKFSALTRLSRTLIPLQEHVPNRTEPQQPTWYIRQIVPLSAGMGMNVKETSTSCVSWTKRGLLYHILLVKVRDSG